ncbi:MAG: PucR family transcriptional regulator ligand-binding domain-containing protein [Nitriliruptoraceae bacterium]
MPDSSAIDRPAATTASRSLRDLLATPVLRGATVIAGSGGLDRQVERLNIMEVPDIGDWVKPREFLLTTAYPLRDNPESLPDLVRDLDAAGLSGMGIKLGRYIDELPVAVLDVANALDFPIVQLPDDVGFDEILNEVLTSILNEQADKLARSEQIHRAFLQLVLRGHGLPEIARDLSALVEAPTVIVDRDGAVLAVAPHDGAPLPAVGDERVSLELATPPHGVVTFGDQPHPCTAVPVVAGHRAYGHVIVVGIDEPATADLLALENAATVCALEMTKSLELQAVEAKYRSDLIHDILRGVDDVDDVRRRATAFGWDFDRRTIVLVLRSDRVPGNDDVAPYPARSPLVAAVEATVTRRDPTSAVVRFTNEVVVLTAAFDAPDGREHARTFARRLGEAASRAAATSVSIGVSRPVPDIGSIPTAYDQAIRALAIGREIQGDGAAAHFDDLGAYRILSLVEDRHELDAFATEVLGSLREDNDQAADLRRTLDAILSTGGNVAEAARILHFHYNTLRYRIDKLSTMLGPFLSDTRVRLDVQLALLIHRMRAFDTPGHSQSAAR